MGRSCTNSLKLPGTVVKRFWSRVDSSAGPQGCWPSTAALNTSGYGTFTHRGVFYTAHRVAFALEYGPLPEGKPYVLHKCNNRRCCNPAHLYAGDAADNGRDRIRAGDGYSWAPREIAVAEMDRTETTEARHRRRKRAEGICGWDGCQEEAGDRYYCRGHREKEAARQRARRLAKHEQKAAA